MRNFIKIIIGYFFKKVFFKYHSKARIYTYNKIKVNVHPDVFPPHFTISTKILLDFLSKKTLHKKTVLELGCGSGIISLFCASKGAIVTASDINPTAVKELETAGIQNKLTLKIILSNLFDNINRTHFDYVIINPPYYPKKPNNTKEQAWFCGEEFEYFEKLFLQLTKIDCLNTLMILSEDCELETIKKIALKNNLKLNCIFNKKVVFEKNYIFKINKIT